MKPYPFEALNHFTVPCSFTATTPQVGIALRLLVAFPGYADGERPQMSQDRDAFSPQNAAKLPTCSALLSGSKGSTRATNARPMVPRKGPFVHGTRAALSNRMAT